VGEVFDQFLDEPWSVGTGEVVHDLGEGRVVHEVIVDFLEGHVVGGADAQVATIVRASVVR
jgi:hypothetical protein